MKQPTSVTALRFRTLFLVVMVVPLGFGLKYYSGPGHAWCNLHGAAVLYELFWCLIAFLAFPVRKAVFPIAVTVFCATCALEFSQLWHHGALEAVRSCPVGVWLIGNGFDWRDFPHYLAGSALGWWVLNRLAASGRAPGRPARET